MNHIGLAIILLIIGGFFFVCIGIYILFLFINREKKLNRLVFQWLICGLIACVIYGFMFNIFINPLYYNSIFKLDFTHPRFLAFLLVWGWRAGIYLFVFLMLFRYTLKRAQNWKNKKNIFPVIFIQIGLITTAWTTDFEKLLLFNGTPDFYHFLHWLGGFTGCGILVLLLYVFMVPGIQRYLLLTENYQKISRKLLFSLLFLFSIFILDIFGILLGCLGTDSSALILFKIAVYSILFFIPLFIIIRKITRDFSGNLIKSVEFLGYASFQDFSHPVEIDSRDEFGILNDSMKLLKNNFTDFFRMSEKTAYAVFESAENITKSLKNLIAEIDTCFDTLKKNDGEQSVSSVIAEKTVIEMAAKIMQITRHIEDQSIMVNENSGSIGEITENTKLISRQTNEVSGVSKELFRIAGDGKEMIENTLKGMREIENASREIDEINRIINDIADKTKILAINAAIESARSGGGKNGFTVIAGEMRKLAEQTNNKASNIRLLVEDILSRILHTLNLSEESQKLFYTIHDLADQIRTSNDSISVAMNDEAGKLGMILTNTEKLVNITGMINVLSGELQNTSGDIKETFSGFSKMVGEESGILAKHSDVIRDLVGKMEIIIMENKKITENLNEMIGKIRIE